MGNEAAQGNEILDMISELVLREKDTDLKARLRKQYKEVNASFRKIYESSQRENPEFQSEVRNQMEKASKSIKESLKDGRKVSRTIQVLSELIDALERWK